MLFVVLATGAFAQSSDNKLRMKLNYNIAMPIGSFKSDYIGNTSFNGAGGEIGYWFNPRVGLGLNVGYQSFYQKYARLTYKTGDNESISAVLSNTIEQVPVMLKGTFAPMANTTAKVQPYVSAGAGINLVNYQQYFGQFSNSDASSAFTAQAGAGFMVPFGSSLHNAALQVGATYNYTPYNKNGLSNLNNVGVNAGVIFPIK
jgi:hypothetical protein